MESNLVNKIKRSIIETKEKKEKLLIERKLVKRRIMMIVESTDNSLYFKRLSKNKQQKIAYSLLEEILYLDEQGMLNEDIMDFMGKIFGNSFGGTIETLSEPMVDSILNPLGLEGYYKDSLISFISENPLEFTNSLKSCESLTELVAKSLSDSVAKLIQKDKGTLGDGHKFIKNSLESVVVDNKFMETLKTQLSGTVCKVFENITNKASNVYNKLKTGISDDGEVGGLLGNSNSTTSPSI